MSDNTKDLILEQARLLFAQHGFKGASVRMIADQANVNLSAISYHFGSKESLYWEVIHDCFHWLSSIISTTVESNDSIEDIFAELFVKMSEHSDYTVSAMKTFLSDMAPQQTDDPKIDDFLKNLDFGPPGGEHIVHFLKRNHPNWSDKDYEWLVHSLFAQAAHFATITQCAFYENFKKNKLSPDQIKENIRLLTKAAVQFVENSN